MENTAREAYKEILGAIKKHRDICVFDVEDLERKAKHHLFGLELKEYYGLNIDPSQVKSLDWVKFGDYKAICWYGDKYNRKISWSDDGTQPDDELLLKICFPTGPYIFGDDYPVELFQTFFQELKSFNPKYTDTANKALYFPIETAKSVFNSFDDIFKKYRELNSEDRKRRQILKLEQELEKLKKATT